MPNRLLAAVAERLLPAAPERARRLARAASLRRSTLACAVALAAGLAGCGGSSPAPSSSSAGVGPLGASGFAGAALPPGIAAPPFTLTDQLGRPISLAGYHGRVTLVTFLYSSCGGPCVLVAEQVRGALDELARPIPVILISADPAADTPQSIARFLQRVSLSGRAEYLTAPPSQLRSLLRSYRVRPPSSDPSAFDSALTVLLIDRRGMERVAFGLEQLTPEGIAHDIRKLERDPAHP